MGCDRWFKQMNIRPYVPAHAEPVLSGKVSSQGSADSIIESGCAYRDLTVVFPLALSLKGRYF